MDVIAAGPAVYQQYSNSSGSKNSSTTTVQVQLLEELCQGAAGMLSAMTDARDMVRAAAAGGSGAVPKHTFARVLRADASSQLGSCSSSPMSASRAGSPRKQYGVRQSSGKLHGAMASEGFQGSNNRGASMTGGGEGSWRPSATGDESRRLSAIGNSGSVYQSLQHHVCLRPLQRTSSFPNETRGEDDERWTTEEEGRERAPPVFRSNLQDFWKALG